MFKLQLELTLTDFKTIQFEYGFPKFALDFFEYITLFKVEEFNKKKLTKNKDKDNKNEEDDNKYIYDEEFENWKTTLG